MPPASDVLPRQPAPPPARELRPRTRLRADPLEDATGSTADRAARPLIVMVDDDAGICWAFENYFVERGWQVKTAASGEQGLELLDDLRLLGQRVDLVLIDISLPGIDGIRAVELYRKLVKLNCRVIAMSAYHGPEVLKELRAHGVELFLEKPIDLAQFDRVLGMGPNYQTNP